MSLFSLACLSSTRSATLKNPPKMWAHDRIGWKLSLDHFDEAVVIPKGRERVKGMCPLSRSPNKSWMCGSPEKFSYMRILQLRGVDRQCYPNGTRNLSTDKKSRGGRDAGLHLHRFILLIGKDLIHTRTGHLRNGETYSTGGSDPLLVGDPIRSRQFSAS